MRLALLLLGSATGLVPVSHLRPVARSRGSALSLHADCGELFSTLTAAAADAAALKPQINELKDIAAPDLNDAEGFSNDALVYLAAAVVVTPLARVLGVSPILGFLLTGLVLGPAGFGAFKDLGVDEELAEIGILFLLFEQGLELTLERLTKLANFAFGLGALQLALCTVAFGAFPFAGGVGLLEWAVHAKPELVAISRPDEALVIGAALSLSSSAFVLQLLAERGERNERFALACLGVLLLQDIAVVPLLVLLPLIEDTQVLGESANVGALAASALQALAALGALLVGGRVVLRRVFAAVAGARSNETFVALCLLVVLGTGAFTDSLGLSSTLGAFAAGTLLAESNYRTQIEADIQPFKGILLGLFFVTTGASVDPSLVASEAPTAFALLAGLLAFKTTIVTALGRLLPFGLTTGEALRAALLLAGGGEFAFVLLTLAERLEVLPPGLAKLDAAIVVLSMALIPALGALGDRAAEWIDGDAAPALAPAGDEAAALAALAAPFPEAAAAARERSGTETSLWSADGRVVICGFGPTGQTVASLLGAPAAGGRHEWLAFDLSPSRVAEARARGFPCFYGDGTSEAVLRAALAELESAADSAAAGVAAFVLALDEGDDELVEVAELVAGDAASLGLLDDDTLEALRAPKATATAIERARDAFPGIPIVARAADPAAGCALGVVGGGATRVVSELGEASLGLGTALLDTLGASRDAITEAEAEVRVALDDRARSMVGRAGEALSTVSGGGVDIAIAGKMGGTRARAAKDLEVFSVWGAP